MIYTDFGGKKLSMLGMGCMRFPVNTDGTVDITKTANLVDLCIKNGINYFDTAWFYHDGKSENIIGELLSKYDRDSFYIADKMPWTVETAEDVENIFEKQLEKTGMDYFDFYLMHNVSDSNVHIFTDEKIGIINYLKKQKNLGRIRHLGFSTHASPEVLEDFVKVCKDDVEFCQIQLNWLDWSLQDAKAKVEILNKYNLPIWVMEPVRGGSLAKLSAEDEATLKALRPDESVAAWAFRFIQSIDNVKMILSGMSDKTQLEDNIRTFSKSLPLSGDEKNVILGVAEKLLSKNTLTCTNCRYCVSECPQNLEIPKLLLIYNNMCLINDAPDPAAVTTDKLPSDCISCGCCEAKCPQNIKISEIMTEFAERLKI